MNNVGLSSSLRAPQFTREIQRLQELYGDAQSQLTSGRPSDLALTLGSNVGRFVNLESQVSSLESFVASNDIVKSRLEVAGSAAGLLQESGDSFSRGLIAGAAGILERDDLARLAKAFTQDIESFGRTTYGGMYVLSGVSSDKPAVREFFDKLSSGRVLVAESFRNVFGIDFSDPSAAALSSAQIGDWINNEFSELFSDDNWLNSWTDASGVGAKARIGENKVVTLSVASDAALRKVVMASVLMLEFPESAVNESALSEVIRSSLSTVQDGLKDLTSFRTANDVIIKRLEDANESALRQKDIYTATVSSLVQVDSFELAVRIEDLRTRLEASYMTTARLNQLSLVNYI